MILIDVNILVYAKRQDSPHHTKFRTWLEEIVRSESVFGMSELVLSSVVRIITHPRKYANAFREHPGCVLISPGERHWEIFTRLCKSAGAKGNLISDAYFAALAMESGAEWITADRDYARFPGLRWRHPLT